ncbi:MAG: hypothetical protein K2Q20_15590 [Phycisphaerales bacterium]|nr:hypothetical protein [Phycisphaerales bacterium]
MRPAERPSVRTVERLCAFFRGHCPAERVFNNYSHLPDTGADAWPPLMSEVLRSVYA